MLTAGGDDINACCFYTTVTKNIGKLGNVSFNSVEHPCKQMPKVMRKHLFRIYLCFKAEIFHFPPDIRPTHWLACAGDENRSCSDNYSPVHIPTEKDEQTKEYLRMRDDHKLALKKVKQQILAFCLRHNYRYENKSHWTAAHIKWLKSLTPEALYKEILDEYLLTYTTLSDKIERMDKRIEELANQSEYKEAVGKLSCFIGVKTHTALSVIVEVGDFNRFADAKNFASYLGIVPGEDTSSDNQNRLSITKAGNRHVRLLLTEAAQSYSRGQVGYNSKALKARQEGNTPQVIAYADKANERLRRRYYKMVLGKSKKANVAKTAIARELACFIWGMMTDHIA